MQDIYDAQSAQPTRKGGKKNARQKMLGGVRQILKKPEVRHVGAIA